MRYQRPDGVLLIIITLLIKLVTATSGNAKQPSDHKNSVVKMVNDHGQSIDVPLPLRIAPCNAAKNTDEVCYGSCCCSGMCCHPDYCEHVETAEAQFNDGELKAPPPPLTTVKTSTIKSNSQKSLRSLEEILRLPANTLARLQQLLGEDSAESNNRYAYNSNYYQAANAPGNANGQQYYSNKYPTKESVKPYVGNANQLQSFAAQQPNLAPFQQSPIQMSLQQYMPPPTQKLYSQVYNNVQQTPNQPYRLNNEGQNEASNVDQFQQFYGYGQQQIQPPFQPRPNYGNDNNQQQQPTEGKDFNTWTWSYPNIHNTIMSTETQQQSQQQPQNLGYTAGKVSFVNNPTEHNQNALSQLYKQQKASNVPGAPAWLFRAALTGLRHKRSSSVVGATQQKVLQKRWCSCTWQGSGCGNCLSGCCCGDFCCATCAPLPAWSAWGSYVNPGIVPVAPPGPPLWGTGVGLGTLPTYPSTAYTGYNNAYPYTAYTGYSGYPQSSYTGYNGYATYPTAGVEYAGYTPGYETGAYGQPAVGNQGYMQPWANKKNAKARNYNTMFK